MADAFRWIHAPAAPNTVAPGSDWADPANWQTLTSATIRAPGAGDSAVFDNGNDWVSLFGPQAAGTLTVTAGASVSLLNGPDINASQVATSQQTLALDDLWLGSGAPSDSGTLLAAPHVTVHVANNVSMQAGSFLSVQPFNPDGITIGDDSHSPQADVYIAPGHTLQGAGQIFAGLTDNGLVDVQGGTLVAGGFGGAQSPIAGSGTIQVEPDGRLALSETSHAGPAGSIADLIVKPDGVLDLNRTAISVTHDFDNQNSGTGNDYDPTANVISTTHLGFQGTPTGYVNGQVNLGLGGDAQTTGTNGRYQLDLGTHHVGDTASASYTLQNNVPADGSLVRGAIQTATIGATIYDADLSGSGVTAQNYGPIAGGAASDPYTVTLNATHAQAGTLGTLHLATNFPSINFDFSTQTTTINQTYLDIIGNVLNHAAFGLNETSGEGSLVHQGNNWVLDLGSVTAGDALSDVHLSVANAAQGPADLLSGNLAVTSADDAIQLQGQSSFSGIPAGSSGDDLDFSFDTAAAGQHSETVTFQPSGSNASGFQEALPDQTLTVLLNVSSGQTQAAEHVFAWIANAGSWNDPANWAEGDYNGSGPYQLYAPLINARHADHAPGAGDIVVFPAVDRVFGLGPGHVFSTNPGVTPGAGDVGPVYGSGEAARLLTSLDWPPITLGGTGSEHYTIGSVELSDRGLIMNDAILDAQRTTLDPTSTLNLISAATGTDAYGRPYSASLGDVTLNAIPPQFGTQVGKILLGSHDIDVTSLHGTNYNGTETNPYLGISGTGHVNFPPTPPSEGGGQVDWNALAAQVEANFAGTGQWFVSGTPPLPQPTDWNALAAQTTVNYEATGQWFL